MECNLCYKGSENIIFLFQCTECREKSLCYPCIKTISGRSDLPDVFKLTLKCPFCNGHLKIIPTDIDYNIKKLDYLWLYEGRNNGWWLYSNDMQMALEEGFSKDIKEISWYTCGQQLSINLKTYRQLNVNRDSIREVIRIKRADLDFYLVKGVGGLNV